MTGGQLHGRSLPAKSLVALAGNPNVGKSTIFNALTGLHQHTGNWPGKTVALAQGTYVYRGEQIALVDLPGTYALASRSPEEALASSFLADGEAACVIAVCDATGLERSLILALQIMELTDRMFVCVNLMDEARAKGIEIDLAALAFELGVPVVGVSAARGEGLSALQEQTRRILDGFERPEPRKTAPAQGEDVQASRFVLRAERIAAKVVRAERAAADARELRADRFLTGRVSGAIVLGLLLLAVFWLTIQGANVPSALLQAGFDALEARLWALAGLLALPAWLTEPLLEGIYQTTARVVSVMLPPVMIFFPLFTLLEDSGYLPRMAFLMDAGFARCGSCGKQALTMCMGFGCNAAGVSGCRIIDSPREQKIAMLTNSLVPCNGRFPALLTLSALTLGAQHTALSGALMLTGCVLLGVGATMATSFALGKTVLRGVPSSFVLELPPYRRPQVGRVIVRSTLDRALRVLARACVVAAPAGLALWWLSHAQLHGVPLLTQLAALLDPAGQWLGMNGTILLAFFLAWPANELLLPVYLMVANAGGTLAQAAGMAVGKALCAAGWTGKTALCVMVFTLFHWPCSTTLLTLYKESGSLRWTLLAALLPTLLGAALCRVLCVLL